MPESEKEKNDKRWGVGNWITHECPVQDGRVVTHSAKFHDPPAKRPPYIFPQRPREERGSRDLYRDTHYDSCDGTICPCYVEGMMDLLPLIMWMASRLENA